MASKAKIARNKRKRKLVDKYSDLRTELKATLVSESASDEEKDQASRRLQRLPRDSSAIRIRNRCFLSGRPRGYYRKFGLSRIALRECALAGEVPGVTKSSW